MASGSFGTILEVLLRHEVEFVVVGGVSAVLQGAPFLTHDLDIVHHRAPDNVRRLEAALRELDARYRMGGQRPAESHLASGGHQLLTTRFGPLDVLGEIEGGRRYPDLASESEWMQIAEGRILVLKLERYVEWKAASQHPKDLAAMPVLRAALEEKRRRG
ncbi:MAG: hypothetical protein R2729_23185 [Bryobacteraceae bacterium]